MDWLWTVILDCPKCSSLLIVHVHLTSIVDLLKTIENIDQTLCMFVDKEFNKKLGWHGDFFETSKCRFSQNQSDIS
jgi:hypothetical protein